MNKASDLTFKDLCDSKFGNFIKVYWNDKLIFDDSIQEEIMFRNPDGSITQVFDDKEINTIGYKSLNKVLAKYKNKKIYNFYCRVVMFHHTELFIQGEE